MISYSSPPAPRNGEIVLMMLTSAGDEYDLRDGKELRRLALGLGIPTVTTVAGCKATAMALQAMRRGPLVQVRTYRRGGHMRAVGAVMYCQLVDLQNHAHMWMCDFYNLY